MQRHCKCHMPLSHTHTRPFTHTHTHTHAHSHTRTHPFTHTHTHMHTDTDTHSHISCMPLTFHAYAQNTFRSYANASTSTAPAPLCGTLEELENLNCPAINIINPRSIVTTEVRFYLNKITLQYVHILHLCSASCRKMHPVMFSGHWQLLNSCMVT